MRSVSFIDLRVHTPRVLCVLCNPKKNFFIYVFLYIRLIYGYFSIICFLCEVHRTHRTPSLLPHYLRQEGGFRVPLSWDTVCCFIGHHGRQP